VSDEVNGISHAGLSETHSFNSGTRPSKSVLFYLSR
jgi:hypothetical protein